MRRKCFGNTVFLPKSLPVVDRVSEEFPHDNEAEGVANGIAREKEREQLKGNSDERRGRERRTE